MKRGPFLGYALLLMAAGASAQSTVNRIPYVEAVGTGTVTIQPDQATLDLGVLTQAQTATAASTQNAREVSAVIGALTGLLGTGASVKTVSYSLTANYSYPTNGQSNLTGYTANNTVEVTIGDLTMIGQAIDAGIQGGANQVVSLQFGLKDDSSARAKALMQATAQAKANADAMASGVGMHTGAVQLISEGTVVRPQPYLAAGAAAPTTTPILPGTLSIQATVTLDVSLTQ